MSTDPFPFPANPNRPPTVGANRESAVPPAAIAQRAAASAHLWTAQVAVILVALVMALTGAITYYVEHQDAVESSRPRIMGGRELVVTYYRDLHAIHIPVLVSMIALGIIVAGIAIFLRLAPVPIALVCTTLGLIGAVGVSIAQALGKTPQPAAAGREGLLAAFLSAATVFALHGALRYRKAHGAFAPAGPIHHPGNPFIESPAPVPVAAPVTDPSAPTR